MDRDERIMDNTSYGRAALKAFGDVPQGFYIFRAGWVGVYPNYHGMEVTGAEFREAIKGPRKGKLCIKIPGTERTTYVSRAAMKENE